MFQHCPKSEQYLVSGYRDGAKKKKKYSIKITLKSKISHQHDATKSERQRRRRLRHKRPRIHRDTHPHSVDCRRSA